MVEPGDVSKTKAQQEPGDAIEPASEEKGKGDDVEMTKMDAFGRKHDVAREEGNEAADVEQHLKALKREGGWKTCLIVTLCIVCAFLMCALIVAMLEQAKYIGFANRDCAVTTGAAPVWQPPAPPSPAPPPPAPPPREVDTVLSACSNNGYLFEGEDACECFACFSGPRCENTAGDDCEIDVNGLCNTWRAPTTVSFARMA